MWFNPAQFFDLDQISDPRLRDFLARRDQVWELLDILTPFIEENLRANVAPLRAEGDFLPRPAALWQGEVFVSGISYELGDPAKRALKVYREGRLLEDAALVMAGAVLTGDDIEIGPGALVESGALIKGPAIIGAFSEVRQGAYLRGGVMSSPGSVIGHTTEAKNTLLMDGAKAGHFAYLGDSILGREVNLGAGTKLANLKIKSGPNQYRVEGRLYEVVRRKFGAVIGDQAETGCNTVTNPGALLGRGVRVFPNTTVPGVYHPPGSFIKNRSHKRGDRR